MYYVHIPSTFPEGFILLPKATAGNPNSKTLNILCIETWNLLECFDVLMLDR